VRSFESSIFVLRSRDLRVLIKRWPGDIRRTARMQSIQPLNGRSTNGSRANWMTSIHTVLAIRWGLEMASKPINPIIQELMDLIQTPYQGYVARPTSQFAHVRDKGSSPHVGFDQNRGHLVPGPVNSPVFGVIGDVEAQPFGRIVIHETDPVTGARTGYDIELLHTESQFVQPKDKVKARQAIGMQGGVGANGVDKKTGNGIPGDPHAHIQVFRGSGPTPLNPLRHLYEYHHPGQPIPPLPEFFPESVPPRPDGPARRDPLLGDDPAAPNGPLGGQGPASPNRQQPTLPADRFRPPPTAMPRSNVGPPLDLTPFQFRNPPASRGGFGPPPDPTGSLYFSPQSPPRQFGPFTLPGPGSSGTDIPAPRNGNPGNSSIPVYSAPGQAGSGTAPAAAPQTINGNAADQAGGGNDIGGVWTTARQYISRQTGRVAPATAPADQVPAAFPENGTQPIGYLNDANQTGTFDPALSGVPLPRLRPPQAPAASWPSAPVAPLLQMPQGGPAAPEHPDWRDAVDWPQQGLPSWAQTQPSTENTFPASPNGVRGLAGAQPPVSQRIAPQPTLPVQNLTTHVLRMKGVPEADIGAAINDPRKMQDLLNQLYGRRSMIAPGDESWGVYNRATQSGPADQPAQVLTPAAIAPENYLPFGWSGLHVR
jgi:hypothetical protein